MVTIKHKFKVIKHPTDMFYPNNGNSFKKIKSNTLKHKS